MFAELIEAISEQAVKAHGAKVIRPDAEPAHLYRIQKPDGTLTELIKAEPQPRKHIAADLTAIAAFSTEPGAVVWYSRSGVLCFTDDANRRDTVLLPLAPSAQLVAIQQLESHPRSFKQADLILFLRTKLFGCLAPSANIVGLLRRVKWKVNQSGEADLQHGRASVGRQIESEVTGTDTLPEYVTFDVPAFASGFPGITGRIQLALEPDAGTQTFQLIPLPGEVERLQCAAETQLGIALAEAMKDANSEAHVYYGKP